MDPKRMLAESLRGAPFEGLLGRASIFPLGVETPAEEEVSRGIVVTIVLVSPEE
jgi:hypothetical protein